MIIAAFVFLAGGTIARGANSLLLNPDFDTDLADWQTTGNVVHSSDFAVLIDAVPASSTLFQSVIDLAISWSFSFDFVGALSSNPLPGGLLDFANVTVFLGDGEFVSPSAPGSFDEFVSVFDLDVNGTRNLAPLATIANHPTRPGWSRLTMTIPTSRTHITPFVEIIDQNMNEGDSSVSVDGFILLPEPSGVIYLVSALALLSGRRRRRVGLRGRRRTAA